jgi:hypothetical protein
MTSKTHRLKANNLKKLFLPHTEAIATDHNNLIKNLNFVLQSRTELGFT